MPQATRKRQQSTKSRPPRIAPPMIRNRKKMLSRSRNQHHPSLIRGRRHLGLLRRRKPRRPRRRLRVSNQILRPLQALSSQWSRTKKPKHHEKALQRNRSQLQNRRAHRRRRRTKPQRRSERVKRWTHRMSALHAIATIQMNSITLRSLGGQVYFLCSCSPISLCSYFVRTTCGTGTRLSCCIGFDSN